MLAVLMPPLMPAILRHAMLYSRCYGHTYYYRVYFADMARWLDTTRSAAMLPALLFSLDADSAILLTLPYAAMLLISL